MKILKFEEVISFIEKEHNIDHRHLKFKDQSVDFWRWLFGAFGFLEDERVSPEGSGSEVFLLNFEEKINEMSLKFENIKKTLAKFDNKFSLTLIKFTSASVSEDSTIDIKLCKSATSESDFDFFLKEGNKRAYIENSLFFRELQRNDLAVKNDLAVNDPEWVLNFVALIDKHFSEHKDSFGNYHFTFEFE